MRYNFIWLLLLCTQFEMNAQSLIRCRDKTGNWGFVNPKGDTVIKPVFRNKPGDFNDGRSVVRVTSNQLLIIDEKGKQQTVNYNSVFTFKNGYAMVTLQVTDTTGFKNKTQPAKKITYYGMIDREGKEIVPPLYENIYGDFSNGWFITAVSKNYRHTYYKKTGDTIVMPEGTRFFSEKSDGAKFIVLKSGKYGIVDKNFKELMPLIHDYISTIENGMYIVTLNGKTGCVNNKLKWVVEPQYVNMQKFLNGYSIVQNEGKQFGAVNEKGQLTTAFINAEIWPFYKARSPLGYYVAPVDKLRGLIDLSTGKRLTLPEYQFFETDYKDGYLYFKKYGKKGIMDSTGKIIVFDQYDDMSPGFSDEMAWVQKNKMYGYINTRGEVVIPLQYDGVRAFQSGLVAVKQNGKYGIVNRQGNIVLPLEYDEIGVASEDFTPVKKNGTWGYANKKGELVIPCGFTMASGFDGGIAYVMVGALSFYIDKKGNRLK